MDRSQKEAMIADLERAFSQPALVVVCHYSGLSVAEFQAFRRQMMEAGGQVRVAKKAFAKTWVRHRPGEELSSRLVGETVIAYTEDPSTLAKSVERYSEANNKLVIVGGAMGAEILDAEGVRTLARMPSRHEVIASIIDSLISPASNLVAAIAAPSTNIASVISRRSGTASPNTSETSLEANNVNLDHDTEISKGSILSSFEDYESDLSSILLRITELEEPYI